MAMRARGIDPFSTGLGGTILINLVLTFTLSGYISVGGHIGGLIGGVICGWVLMDFGPKQLKDDRAILGAVVAHRRRGASSPPSSSRERRSEAGGEAAEVALPHPAQRRAC